MAFAAYWNCVNTVLLNAGEDPFTSTGQFDGAASGYGKLQGQAKSFMAKAHARIMQRGHFRYLRKPFTITTSNASNVYNLTGFNAEDIRPKSMFNTTSGFGGGYIVPIDYDDWLSQFPNGEVAQGVPVRYFLYPAGGSDADTLGFSPPPSGVFTIQMEYDVPPVQLVNSTDLVQVRTRDLYILLDHCQMWVEVSKSEGKAPDFAVAMEMLFEELRQGNTGDPSRPPKVTFQMRQLGLRKRNGQYAYSPIL